VPPRLTLRVDFGPRQSIGPGKMRLLEAIDSAGSISGAGRALGMSYRRAWMLIDDLNGCFTEKVVTTALGGKEGGGAKLTPFGQNLLKHYRAIETEAATAAKKHIAFLARSLSEKPPAEAKRTRISK
jgi:molybdate transport system regulatory protein